MLMAKIDRFMAKGFSGS